MEIELKIRLTSAAAHQTLPSLLSPYHLVTHCQHNTFFDGVATEVSSRRAVLRLRFYGDDPPCVVVNLKTNAVLTNGVSRVEAEEEELDPRVGRDCMADPRRLNGVRSRVMDRVRDDFEVSGGNGFVCLGGFRNVRGVYDWNGLVLEVDETFYEFGTCYEIECESLEPEEAKDSIEGFSRRMELGILTLRLRSLQFSEQGSCRLMAASFRTRLLGEKEWEEEWVREKKKE
ncbi:hypothetical protein RHMOL_Rhmol01G0046900 [Rhododendron molle]|uniref:Uncharacterized protein n=1 Tax=Rhododendron molle TaxID=49168 RepID=A0ACC0PXW6_RHOML|nr:hypothetical protein RHMOL_Rhmol01G0046900 [Rhododendron molle]